MVLSPGYENPFTSLKESVGKIKNRENRGYKTHSTHSKNSLEGKCGPKVFRKVPELFFPTDSLSEVLVRSLLDSLFGARL
jgi:hypothetical protein